MAHERDRATQLFSSFLEQWHNDYPTKRIDPAMYAYLKEYFLHAYTAGYDDYRFRIEKAIEKSLNADLNNISILKFRKNLTLA